jgi:hypothetical protein
MKEHQHLSWENFMSSVLVKGQQRVHRISSSPLIEIFGDGINDRVGIWLESITSGNIPEQVQRLASVSVQTVERDETLFLEIVSSSGLINRHF